MKFISKAQAKRETRLSYLGGVATSSKIAKGLNYEEMTYGIYLSPANLSGYEVCPLRTKECTDACLNESGRNRIDKNGVINNSRISKTKMFFEQRDFFMNWLVAEITAAKKKAEKNKMRFSVRLNCTSDLSMSQFNLNGKNILEIFPDVQFYDYTKVYRRIELMRKYTNYDLTFSYSGENTDDCIKALQNGMRVAVVFENVLPSTFLGHNVIDGDNYDMRYLDEKNVIVGLTYKRVRNKIDLSKSKFIVTQDKLNTL